LAFKWNGFEKPASYQQFGSAPADLEKSGNIFPPQYLD